jgi:protein phosphatase
VTSAAWTDRESGCAARAGAASLIGNYRENNEDLVLLDRKYPLALVLDGMGGQAAGEIASRTGGEAIRRAVRRGLRAGHEPRALIENALRVGNKAVLELGRFDRDMRNCGTTVVLALLHRGTAYVSWLGDSPAYRVSGGRIEKLTWEHNLRNALVRHGTISEEEARQHHIHNVLWRYLGSPDLADPVEVPSFTPLTGDRLLLATDGVTNIIPEADLLEVCRSHPEPKACAEELANLAVERGSRDNCTCAVIAFDQAGAGPPAAPPAVPQQSRKWWRFWR